MTRLPRQILRRTLTQPLVEARGTALIMAVIAMLILGVMAVSFTSIGGLEARIGIGDYREKQAVLVAEAGIHAVRNQLRADLPTNFTNYLGRTYTCTPSGCSCAGGVGACSVARLSPVGTGTFSVLVSNDPGEGLADVNGRVVLTSVGTTAAGNSRARIGGWVTLDSAWKHVCASDDTPCYAHSPPPDADGCPSPGATQVSPCSFDDPNGPTTFDALPVPCHSATCNTTGNPLFTGGPLDWPLGQPQYRPGNSSANRILPYYNMALRSNCNIPGSGFGATHNPWPAGQGCVFDGNQSFTGKTFGGPAGPFGAVNGPVVVYVAGTAKLRNGTRINGTLVVHGDTGGSTDDITATGQVTIDTLTSANPAYPMALLLFNPTLLPDPPPAQPINADISNQNVTIRGLIYSGGSIEFNPINVLGGVVAFNVTLTGQTDVTYQSIWEGNLPPPGFAVSPGTITAILLRGTWIQCRNANNNNYNVATGRLAADSACR